MADNTKSRGRKYESYRQPKEDNPIPDLKYQTDRTRSLESSDLGVGELDYLPASIAARAEVERTDTGHSYQKKTGREIIGYHTVNIVGPEGQAAPMEVPDYKDIYTTIPIYQDKTILRPSKEPGAVGKLAEAAQSGLGINDYQTRNALRIDEERKKFREELAQRIESGKLAAIRKEAIGQAQNAIRRDIRSQYRMQKMDQQQYASGFQLLVGNDQQGNPAGITQIQPMQVGLTKAALAQRARRTRESISLGRPLSRKEREYVQISGQRGPPQQGAPQQQSGPQYNPQSQYQPQYQQPPPEPNGFFNVPAQNQQQGGGNAFFEEARAAQIASMAPQGYQQRPFRDDGMTIPGPDPFTPSYTQQQPQRFGQSPPDAGSPFQQNIIQVRGGIPADRVQDAGSPFGRQRQGPPVDAGSPFGQNIIQVRGGMPAHRVIDAGSPFGGSRPPMPNRVMIPGHMVGKKRRGPPPSPNPYQPDPIFGI